MVHVSIYISNVFLRSTRLRLIQIILQNFLFFAWHCRSISIVLLAKFLIYFYRNEFLIFRRARRSWIMWSNLNVTLHRLTVQFSCFPFVYLYKINITCILIQIIHLIHLFNAQILNGIILLQTAFSGLVFWYFGGLLLETYKIWVLKLFST